MDLPKDGAVDRRRGDAGATGESFVIDMSGIAVCEKPEFTEEALEMIGRCLAAIRARDESTGEAVARLKELVDIFGKMVAVHMNSEDFAEVFALLSVESVQVQAAFLIFKLMDVSDDAVHAFTEFGVFPKWLQILRIGSDPLLQRKICEHLSRMIRRYSEGDELVEYMNREFVDVIRPFCLEENPCRSLCVRMLEDACPTMELIESAIDIVFVMALAQNVDVAVNALATIAKWMTSECDVENRVTAMLEDPAVLGPLRERLGSQFTGIVCGVLHVFEMYMYSETPREIGVLLSSGIIDATKEMLCNAGTESPVIHSILNLYEFISKLEIEIICPFLDRLLGLGLDFACVFDQLSYACQNQLLEIVLNMAITAPGQYTLVLMSQRMVTYIVERVETSDPEVQRQLAQNLAFVIAKNDGRGDHLKTITEMIVTMWSHSEQCLEVCPDLTTLDISLF